MRPALFVLLLALAAPACSDPASPGGDTIRATGTVTYMTVEGGFWAIRGDNGTTYDPLGGLPAEFQQENLRVRFEGRIRDDMGGIHMVGPIIEIVRIERLS